jgi:hypothetical protein
MFFFGTMAFPAGIANDEEAPGAPGDSQEAYKRGFSIIVWTGCAVGVSIWSAGVSIGREDESVVKRRRESVGQIIERTQK